MPLGEVCGKTEDEMDNLLLPLILIAPFIGSFLGVLIVRLPLGEGVVTGRSKCPECGHRLAGWHLIPFISYIFQRGKCAYCAKKIPVLYPAIEIAALLVVLWAALLTTGTVFVISCFLGWGLLALAVIDWRDLILPDVLTLPLMVGGMVAIAILNPDQIMMHLAAMVAAILILGGLAYFYKRIRRKEGMGWGDVKLFAAAGAWVGPEGLGTVLLISTFFALLVTFLLALLRNRRPGRFQKIAFGCYMSLGIWLTWLYGPLMWF